MKAIGASKEDFSASGARYDVIFDTVGKCPKPQATRALKPDGMFVTIAQLNTKQTLEELTSIKELIEAGKLRAAIDRCYPLDQVVVAHRYVETGHKAGNVVIQVA